MSKRIFFISFWCCFLFSTTALAEAIPLQNVAIRISPKTQIEGQVLIREDTGLGSKTVTIDRVGVGFKATWYSIIKELDESGDYPTYKIKPKRGVITVDGLENRTHFLLPELWAQGYLKADLALPLWVDPAYLKLKGREKRTFNPGLVSNNSTYLRQASPEAFERLTYFQNLYDQIITDGDVRDGVQLSKMDQREIKKFTRDFFLSEKIARTKASLMVNGIKESYPSVIIGNEYYHLIVIDDPLSPLVVGFTIYADKAPRLFQDIFMDFKRLFEFQVTQITRRN